MSDVIDVRERNRFELQEPDGLAYADYRRQGGRMLIDYVYAPSELRGTGAAGRLMEGVLAQARAEGVKVVPICGYAGAYIRRHREHQDLLG